MLRGCWTPTSPLGNPAKHLEEAGGCQGEHEDTNNTRWYFSASFWAKGIFERILTQRSGKVHSLQLSGRVITRLLITKLTFHVLQSLALADNIAFRNCLVVMQPKTTSTEVSSMHDVSTHLHNKTQRWLHWLKSEILVSDYIL